MTKACLGALAHLGHEVTGAEEPAIDDYTLAGIVSQIKATGAETLVILQPSLGHGQLAVGLSQLWPGPVVLWATPERPDVEKVSSCSLVAQNLWSSILRQSGHPFEFVYGHPDEDTTRQQLHDAIRVCVTAARLKGAKVGLVGTHSPGFIDLAVDPFVLRRDTGAQIHPLSLPQFMDRVREVPNDNAQQRADEIEALKLPAAEISRDDLLLSGSFEQAMLDLIAEEKLDALAVQCWPEIPNVLGQWPYLAMSRVADRGDIISMEGDADGALLLLIGKWLGAGVGFVTDWLEHDASSIHFWHPGMAALSMLKPASSDAGPVLAHHFNIAKPLVVDGQFREGEAMTVARFWKCDGRYAAMAFEGTTIPARRKVTGNTALVERAEGDVLQLFEALVHEGLPHHVVLFYGRHEARLRRLCRMLGVRWVGSAA